MDYGYTGEKLRKGDIPGPNAGFVGRSGNTAMRSIQNDEECGLTYMIPGNRRNLFWIDKDFTRKK